MAEPFLGLRFRTRNEADTDYFRMGEVVFKPMGGYLAEGVSATFLRPQPGPSECYAWGFATKHMHACAATRSAPGVHDMDALAQS